jgi:hypothetical protein
MAGGMITVADTLLCPHGGTVTIVPTNARVAAGGMLAATVADTFIIVGCPFQIPMTPPIPSPCVTVQWLGGDLRSTVGGVPTLSQSSQGICIAVTGVPQGPVIVVSTQPGTQSQ